MRAVLAAALFFCVYSHAWTLRATNLGGWLSTPLTVQYNFTGCSRTEAELLGILDAAIATWNQSQDSGMRLARAGTASTATAADVKAGTASPTPIVVCDTGFTVNQGVDGDYVPALTLLAALDSHIAFAGIVLNSESGKFADIAALPLEEVSVALAHEMGHALGLGHSGNRLALMYYSISGKTSVTLTQDDMDGISYLYPRNEFTAGPYGCASTHRTARSAGALWFVLLLLANWILGRMYTRPRRLSECH